MRGLFEQATPSPKGWLWIFLGVVLLVIATVSAFVTWVAIGVFVPGGELLTRFGLPFAIVTFGLGLVAFARARRLRGER